MQNLSNVEKHQLIAAWDDGDRVTIRYLLRRAGIPVPSVDHAELRGISRKSLMSLGRKAASLGDVIKVAWYLAATSLLLRAR